jgi:sec-independent protein translocase protein TatC
MAAAPNQQEDPGLHPVSGYSGGPEMTLVEHLLELRRRVVVCAIAVVVSSLLCFWFWSDILGWMLAPAREQIPDFRVASFSPIDRIEIIFKIGLYGGLIVSSPVLIYEALAFIVPGLTPRERRVLLPGVFGVILFLLAGMAFAYWIILPASLDFLLNLGSSEIESVTGVKQYVDFVIRIVFWVGVGFELPMVMAVMARLGMVRARQFINFWRYAIVLIAIVAAVITPTPDAYTLTLVAGPMLFLYVVGIFFAWILQPRRPKPA